MESTCLDLGCGTGMLTIAAAFCCSVVIAIDCDDDALFVAHENAVQVELDDTIQFLQGRVEMKKATKNQEISTALERTTSSNGTKKTTGVRNKGTSPGGRRGRGARGRGGGGRRPTVHQSQNDDLTPLTTKDRIILNDKDGIPLKSKSVDVVVTNPPFGTKHNEGIDVQFLRTATRLARRAVYSFHKTSTRPYLMKLVQEEWGYPIQVAAEMKFDIPQMYKFHQQKNVDIQVDLLRVVVAEDEVNAPSPERPVGARSSEDSIEYDGEDLDEI